MFSLTPRCRCRSLTFILTALVMFLIAPGARPSVAGNLDGLRAHTNALLYRLPLASRVLVTAYTAVLAAHSAFAVWKFRSMMSMQRPGSVDPCGFEIAPLVAAPARIVAAA